MNRRLAKCPDFTKGLACDICGAQYVCLEPWRKARTNAARLKAKKEFNAARRKKKS